MGCITNTVRVITHGNYHISSLQLVADLDATSLLNVFACDRDERLYFHNQVWSHHAQVIEVMYLCKYV